MSKTFKAPRLASKPVLGAKVGSPKGQHEDPAVNFVLDVLAHRFENPLAWLNKKTGKAGLKQTMVAQEIGTLIKELDPERFGDKQERINFTTSLVNAGLIKQVWGGFQPAFADLRYEAQSTGSIAPDMQIFLERYKAQQGN